MGGISSCGFQRQCNYHFICPTFSERWHLRKKMTPDSLIFLLSPYSHSFTYFLQADSVSIYMSRVNLAMKFRSKYPPDIPTGMSQRHLQAQHTKTQILTSLSHATLFPSDLYLWEWRYLVPQHTPGNMESSVTSHPSVSCTAWIATTFHLNIVFSLISSFPNPTHQLLLSIHQPLLQSAICVIISRWWFVHINTHHPRCKQWLFSCS